LWWCLEELCPFEGVIGPLRETLAAERLPRGEKATEGPRRVEERYS
tara:strand:+ start:201 stop:338 length:138 start_codon:yes stop_codon:yes gene_type:complete